MKKYTVNYKQWFDEGIFHSAYLFDADDSSHAEEQANDALNSEDAKYKVTSVTEL